MKVYLIFILVLCSLTHELSATTYYSQSNGNFSSDAIWYTTESGSSSEQWVKGDEISNPSTHDFIVQHNVTLPSSSISVKSIVIKSGKYLYHMASGTAGQSTLTVTNLNVIGILYIRNNYVNLTIENIYFLEGSNFNLTESVANITHNGMFYSNSVTTLTLDLASPTVSGLLGDYIDGTITADNTLRYPSGSLENTLADLPTEFLEETGSITLDKDYTLKVSSAIPSTFTIAAGTSANAEDNGSIEFLEGASGTFTATNTNPFNNVRINTASGITLGRSLVMGGELFLDNGILTTSTYRLTIEEGGSVDGASYSENLNATSSGGSDASHVDGEMRLEVAAGTKGYVLLPIGDANMLRVGGVQNLVASPSSYILTAQYFHTPYSDVSNISDLGVNVSSVEHWEIEVDGSAVDVDNTNYNFNVAVSYHSNSGVNESQTASLHLMHYNSGATEWFSEGNVGGGSTHVTPNGGLYTGGSVTGFVVDAVKSFSPFTLGGDSDDHDLPITLKSFEVEKEGDALNFNWVTAQEINNDYFELEGSTDRKYSNVLAKIEGAGNSNVEINYTQTVTKGLWETYQYFRLKQTDYDGQFSYSEWVQVGNNDLPNNFDYIIYPNPSSTEINIETTALINETISTYQIFDLNGKRYRETQWDATHHTIDISTLPKGIYMLMISTASGKKKIQRFTVQ
ncbi:T9SS type A sorting domain-containing protein [Flammeovirga sp. OC4]|uniref:T9SS type A sorting domain-containing protein n=1 Tax=Flammeovirga sp. OC4 TaxID=1382345 RepID=UPI0009E51652|nr:T9SS type A sorting domain-containing protein [Flammeovirga sp. OC4]